jgi:hypothetical protein
MITEAPRGAIWLADAFVYYLDKIGALIDWLHSPAVRDRAELCRTPQELRDYAATIQESDPSLAADLIAAANRSEN